MSCPSCQVAGRRLPSLPLAYITKTQNRIVCKGFNDSINNGTLDPFQSLGSKANFLTKMQKTSTNLDGM